MNQENKTLEQIAELRKIRIHEPFAEFLHAEPSMHSFEISLSFTGRKKKNYDTQNFICPRL